MSPKSINDFLIRMFVCVVFFFSSFLLSGIQSMSPSSSSCTPSDTFSSRLDNKLALSPLVFTGRLTASSIPSGNLHWVSLRVLRVHRGRLNKRLKRTIRLQFALSCGGASLLPAFNPRSSRRKYLFFVARLGPGVYRPLGTPQVLNRKSKRVLKKVLCKNCLEKPSVKSISLNSRRRIREGGSLKLKCLLSSPGVPGGKISWSLNSAPLVPGNRISIRSKKKRSVLRIQGLRRRQDSGEYRCSATNVLGTSVALRRILVDSNNDNPPHKVCPIPSFCLNQGSCSFYEMIGELVCKCKEGFAGHRCQFKKAKISLPFDEDASPCGLYSHDYHLREICAAWRQSPELTEMTLEEYREWKRVEKALEDIKQQRNNKLQTHPAKKSFRRRPSRSEGRTRYIN